MSFVVIVNSLLLFTIPLDIIILLPATKVTLSNPFATKLSWVACPLTSQYLKVLFILIFTAPGSNGSTVNPASSSNRIVLIFVHKLPTVFPVVNKLTFNAPPINALAGIVASG